MRIAVSGSHRVGKSTLVERLADALPRHAAVDEPYALLEDDGRECCDPPSLEDFEAQLERSLAALEDGAPDAVFDRCPIDILAYLVVHDDAGGFDPDGWLERIRAAIETLEVIVFVPIEDPDRIALPSHEDRAYRRAVDDRLRAWLVDDALGLGTEVVIAEGAIDARVAQVMARLRR